MATLEDYRSLMSTPGVVGTPTLFCISYDLGDSLEETSEKLERLVAEGFAQRHDLDCWDPKYNPEEDKFIYSKSLEPRLSIWEMLKSEFGF
jgi:hypothetical protein